MLSAKTIVIIVFVSIFVGFILLLVFSSNMQTNNNSSTEDDDEDGNSTHTDWGRLLDLSISASTCPECNPEVTIRDAFCNASKFVAVFKIRKVNPTETEGRTLYDIDRISELKQFPSLDNSSLLRSVVLTESVPNCPVQLAVGKNYLVTGQIEPLTFLSRITSCDGVIEWSSLSEPRQHAYFKFFDPKLSC